MRRNSRLSSAQLRSAKVNSNFIPRQPPGSSRQKGPARAGKSRRAPSWMRRNSNLSCQLRSAKVNTYSNFIPRQPPDSSRQKGPARAGSHGCAETPGSAQLSSGQRKLIPISSHDNRRAARGRKVRRAQASHDERLHGCAETPTSAVSSAQLKSAKVNMYSCYMPRQPPDRSNVAERSSLNYDPALADSHTVVHATPLDMLRKNLIRSHMTRLYHCFGGICAHVRNLSSSNNAPKRDVVQRGRCQVAFRIKGHFAHTAAGVLALFQLGGCP